MFVEKPVEGRGGTAIAGGVGADAERKADGEGDDKPERHVVLDHLTHRQSGGCAISAISGGLWGAMRADAVWRVLRRVRGVRPPITAAAPAAPAATSLCSARRRPARQ